MNTKIVLVQDYLSFQIFILKTQRKGLDPGFSVSEFFVTTKKDKRNTVIPLDLPQEMLADFKAKKIIFQYKPHMVIFPQDPTFFCIQDGAAMMMTPGLAK